MDFVKEQMQLTAFECQQQQPHTLTSDPSLTGVHKPTQQLEDSVMGQRVEESFVDSVLSVSGSRWIPSGFTKPNSSGLPILDYTPLTHCFPC